MTPQEYISGLLGRLAADGCAPRWDTTTSPFLIGHRSDVRAATRIHLFTIAAVVPEITVPVLEQFTDFALNAAVKRRKGLPRGLRTCVGVFPALISDRVEPAAARRASVWQRTRFAGLGRPTVVDTANRRVDAYRDTPIAGFFYAQYLRGKNEQYFPQP